MWVLFIDLFFIVIWFIISNLKQFVRYLSFTLFDRTWTEIRTIFSCLCFLNAVRTNTTRVIDSAWHYESYFLLFTTAHAFVFIPKENFLVSFFNSLLNLNRNWKLLSLYFLVSYFLFLRSRCLRNKRNICPLKSGLLIVFVQSKFHDAFVLDCGQHAAISWIENLCILVLQVNNYPNILCLFLLSHWNYFSFICFVFLEN